MIRTAIALLAAFAATAANAAEKPSFDCSTATTAREKVVCGDARLARADRAMATAYRSARDRADPATRALLLADQKAFLEGLDGGFEAEMWFKASIPEEPTFGADIRRALREKGDRLADLAVEMERRAVLLRDFAPDRAGIDGTWVAHDVDLTIAAADGGGHTVTYEAPSYGWPKYHCAFHGVARTAGDRLVIEAPVNDDFDETRPATIELRRDGRVLRLVEHRRDGEPPVCAHRSSLEDVLLPAEPRALPKRRWHW